MTCLTEDSLLRNELGELTTNEVEALRAHLATCSRCQEKQAGIVAMLGDVAQVAASREGMDDVAFSARVGQRIRAPETAPPARRSPRWPLWAVAAGLLLLPTGFFLGAKVPWRHTTSGTFTARGGDPRPASAEALLVRDGKLLPLAGKHLRATDALAVRVKNHGLRSIHVLAFARDRAGEVHWLYPAYQNGADNPFAVEIPAGANTHLLPDLVAPESPAPGDMTVMTVLLDRPIAVKEVEARLAKTPDPARAFPRAQIEQWTIATEEPR
jgi:anti-sigma factor RsiW